MIPVWRRDFGLIAPMAILIGIGWVMVFSTAAVLGAEAAGKGPFYHLARQIVATGIGALAMVVILRLPFGLLEAWTPRFLAICSGLMLLVFIPGLGHTVGRATRWLDLGPITFQPVEPFKLAVVSCLSLILARERAREAWPSETWLKLGGVTVLALALPMLQRDFGSAILMFGLAFLLMGLAGGRVRYLLGTALTGLLFAGFAIAVEPYRIKRLTMYLSHLVGGAGGYQTRQSLIALGAGGIFGVGLGESTQKLFYLPSSHADFIFAILGEEGGFIGGVMVLVLYLLILRKGLGVARLATGRFPHLLAAGMAFLLFMQALWHIAVVLVLVPTKGLALPFVSYGGSSLVASMMAVGFILRCAAEPAASGSVPSTAAPLPRGREQAWAQ